MLGFFAFYEEAGPYLRNSKDWVGGRWVDVEGDGGEDFGHYGLCES